METDRESAERYERERKEAHERAERERKEERMKADLRRKEARERHDQERSNDWLRLNDSSLQREQFLLSNTSEEDS